MDKVSFVQDGVVKLPPGFRFHPTDEELVIQYLGRKVLSYPLPAAFIPELELSKFDPWELAGDCGCEGYFFTRKEGKHHAGKATISGYWKPTGSEKKVVALRTNQIVGMKKALAFYKSKPRKESKTDWLMHEYRLADVFSKNTNHVLKIPSEDWVLCHIFLKKRKQKNGTKRRCRGPVRSRNVGMEPSSPEASVITELSTIESSSEEINSSDNISSSSCFQ